MLDLDCYADGTAADPDKTRVIGGAKPAARRCGYLNLRAPGDSVVSNKYHV